MDRSVSIGLVLVLVLLASTPRALLGQTPAAAVPLERPLHSTPNGTSIGTSSGTAALSSGERRDGWVQVTLEGWVWERSLRKTSRSDYPLVVSEQAGENVREDPAGTIVARLESGTLLRELERKPGWIRVSRQAWVRDDAPAREGAILPARDSADVPQSADLGALPPSRVVASPDAFIGHPVRWELQFIALERAEAIRTDFYPGEPFMLARSATGDRMFLYVAVPPERVGEVSKILPLETLTVFGRIRTGAAALTGRPILDLVRIQRTRVGGEGRGAESTLATAP